MTDTYNQLKDELSVLYPGIKDLELNKQFYYRLNKYSNFFITQPSPCIASSLQPQFKNRQKWRFFLFKSSI